MAKGNIVCFTDSDCLVENNWLRKINDFFAQNPYADGVGGPVYQYYTDQGKIQKMTGELFVQDQGYPKEIRKLKFGSFGSMIFGSNSAYKKEAFVSVGSYSKGGSNLELCWRLTREGRNLFFNPSITCRHIFPWSLVGVLEQQFRWGLQSTQMKRANRLDEGKMREFALTPYFLVKRLLSLLTMRDLDKRMLHLLQLASYSFGQVYGYGR
jgi:cellulose synthase/poly-beta-1,6-N-acetylglucosamine synthase-like glycosyltransferase